MSDPITLQIDPADINDMLWTIRIQQELLHDLANDPSMTRRDLAAASARFAGYVTTLEAAQRRTAA